MRTNFLVALVLVSCVAITDAGTLQHYINRGAVTSSDPTPQIDAVSFENRNLFSVSTTRPFETFNTLNVTNTAAATMENSSSGFWFDHSYLGGRSLLANWVNRGLVSGQTTVWVDSTNILNAGQGIGVGSRGIIHLNGDNVNLSRSGLYVGNLYGVPSGFIFNTGGYDPNANGFSDGGLQDVYWGIGSNSVTKAVLAADLTLPAPHSPPHSVTTTGISSNFFGNRFTVTQILPSSRFFIGSGLNPSLTNYTAYVITNSITGNAVTTNTIQVVFVPTNGITQGVGIDVRWSPNTLPNGTEVGAGFGNTAVVEFSLADYNPVNGVSFTNYLYLSDYLAFQTTNMSLIPNFSSALTAKAATRRPNTYVLNRSDFKDFTFDSLSVSNFAYSPDLVAGAAYLSNTLNMAYAAYSARLVLGENLLSARSFSSLNDIEWAGLPINDITNLAGRIEIKSKKLNLDNIRVQAQSGLIVQTDELVGNKLPIVNAPLISYDLRSKLATPMVVSNLVATNVNRLLGDISCYSAIWQNGFTNATETNLYRFHVLIVDHSLSLTQAVVLQDLKLHSTNLVISDKLNVARNFLIDARNLEVSPSGAFTNGTGFDVGGSNLFGLWNFTNRGVFSAKRELRMGTDGSSALSNIVNYSIITASSTDLKAQRVINTNVIRATSGSVGLDADNLMLLPGSTITSLGPTILSGKNLTASNSTIVAGIGTAGGHLVLSFTETVKDGGAGTSNIWVTSDGFTFGEHQPTGDLLYTTIISTATNENEVIHYVGAQDFGVEPEGYVDNMALGRLILDGSTNTIFRFSPPAGRSNVALYVEYLELRNYATNYQDSIVVDEGCRLYFANSSVGTKKVSHSSDDRMRWVSTYAGPNSSTNMGSYTINLGLAQAPDIDSDNDGLDNASDSDPVWTELRTSLGISLQNIALTNRPVVTLTGLVLSSYDNGSYINYATNSLYRIAGGSGTRKLLTNIVTAPVTTIPSPGTSVSAPFIFYDLGATDTNGFYQMIIDLSEP